MLVGDVLLVRNSEQMARVGWDSRVADFHVSSVSAGSKGKTELGVQIIDRYGRRVGLTPARGSSSVQEDFKPPTCSPYKLAQENTHISLRRCLTEVDALSFLAPLLDPDPSIAGSCQFAAAKTTDYCRTMGKTSVVTSLPTPS